MTHTENERLGWPTTYAVDLAGLGERAVQRGRSTRPSAVSVMFVLVISYDLHF